MSGLPTVIRSDARVQLCPLLQLQTGSGLVELVFCWVGWRETMLSLYWSRHHRLHQVFSARSILVFRPADSSSVQPRIEEISTSLWATTVLYWKVFHHLPGLVSLEPFLFGFLSFCCAFKQCLVKTSQLSCEIRGVYCETDTGIFQLTPVRKGLSKCETKMDKIAFKETSVTCEEC